MIIALYYPVSHIPFSFKFKTIKQKKTEEREQLELLYKEVRNIRESKQGEEKLADIFNELKLNHPKDWLLTLEIAELAHHLQNDKLFHESMQRLEQLQSERPEIAHLIKNGILIFSEEVV